MTRDVYGQCCEGIFKLNSSCVRPHGTPPQPEHKSRLGVLDGDLSAMRERRRRSLGGPVEIDDAPCSPFGVLQHSDADCDELRPHSTSPPHHRRVRAVAATNPV